MDFVFVKVVTWDQIVIHVSKVFTCLKRVSVLVSTYSGFRINVHGHSINFREKFHPGHSYSGPGRLLIFGFENFEHTIFTENSVENLNAASYEIRCFSAIVVKMLS